MSTKRKKNTFRPVPRGKRVVPRPRLKVECPRCHQMASSKVTIGGVETMLCGNRKCRYMWDPNE